MIRLKMENYNTILTEKQYKYLHYQRIKLIEMNILQATKYYLPIKVKLQNKLSSSSYSSLGKASKKKKKKKKNN